MKSGLYPSDFGFSYSPASYWCLLAGAGPRPGGRKTGKLYLLAFTGCLDSLMVDDAAEVAKREKWENRRRGKNEKEREARKKERR